jgi:hypothetical protein
MKRKPELRFNKLFNFFVFLISLTTCTYLFWQNFNLLNMLIFQLYRGGTLNTSSTGNLELISLGFSKKRVDLKASFK